MCLRGHMDLKTRLSPASLLLSNTQTSRSETGARWANQGRGLRRCAEPRKTARKRRPRGCSRRMLRSQGRERDAEQSGPWTASQPRDIATDPPVGLLVHLTFPATAPPEHTTKPSGPARLGRPPCEFPYLGAMRLVAVSRPRCSLQHGHGSYI